MQPLVFGHGHLLHSRDCENCRRVCVFLCHVLCVCVWSKCVSTHVRCCHLKRMGEANAFKPYRAQLCIDEHVKSLRLIQIHVKMSSHSTHVKWRQIKGCFIYFLVKVMLQSAVFKIHLNVFSSNQTPLCSELVCFCGFQFSDRFKKKSIPLKVLAHFFSRWGMKSACTQACV